MGEWARAVEGVGVMDAEFWQGRRVLVTGHTGFKGSWLTMWLKALGADVVGLALAPVGRSLFAEARVAGDCTSHCVDLRDARAVRDVVAAADPDVVFHLAAQALVRPSYGDPAETWNTNVTGTIHLLEALRTAPRVTAIVVVTSDKCYEHVGPEHPFVEGDPLGGHDPYSSSKAAAEIATAAWRRSFFDARGVGVATARAGNVIGGGDWAVDRLVPDLMRSVTEDRHVQIRSPRARRPWQHVLEPLRGYLMLAERLAEEPVRFGGAWNFGPGERHSMEVAVLFDAFDDEINGIDWHFADEGEEASMLHEAERLSLSIDKAQRELGWSPLLSIDEAIKLTAAAYRVAIDGGDQRRIVLAQIADYVRRVANAASKHPVARTADALTP